MVPLWSRPAAASLDPMMDKAVADLCGKEVVMLGEASHGDGETFAVKAELIRRLHTECGFNALFFEAGIYDFLDLNRRLDAGESVTSADVTAGIIVYWRKPQEVKPLLDLLTKSLVDHFGTKIYLGGIDDQLSGVYAAHGMAEEFLRTMPESWRPKCNGLLRDYTSYVYYAHRELFTVENKEKLLSCLSAVDSATSSGRVRAMTQSLRRLIANNFMRVDQDKGAEVRSVNLRDASMFQNFQFLKSQLAPGGKVILWGANFHFLKFYEGVETAGFDGVHPFGEYVHRVYGDRAASVAITALSGTFGLVGAAASEIHAASGGLEAEVMRSSAGQAVYLNRYELGALGVVVAGPLGYSPRKTTWSRHFDAMIVLPKEHAPTP